jgi:branched-chain amino acid aminotransferase
MDTSVCNYFHVFSPWNVSVIQRLIKISARGPSLYLRPTMIATDASISVSRPRSALFYVIASPMSSYFKGKGGSSMDAVSLKATSSPVRAWPGGVGDKKLGGNYAPSIVPQEEAVAEGFQQNLWLLGDPTNPEDQYVTEAGTMNLFVAWTSPVNGQRELVTPPLDGVILPGVTRDSILTLARERLEPRGWVVSERPIRMIDIQRAAKQGHLLEMFGAGTAAVVNPVRSVDWQGERIDCGLKPDEDAGPLTKLMKDWIEDIQYGAEEHPWRYVFSRSSILATISADEAFRVLLCKLNYLNLLEVGRIFRNTYSPTFSFQF